MLAWNAIVMLLMVMHAAVLRVPAKPLTPAFGVNGTPFHVAADSIPRAQISGSLLRPGGRAKGTVFMCHGFGRSSWDFRGYDWIADREAWNVVRFDFRQHGNSSRDILRAPTLGYYEIWDLKAVIDWAEAQKLEKPYVCYGVSMGGAIALRWAGDDPRITAVLAQSSFSNALDASEKFRPGDRRVRIAKVALEHTGLREMLRVVDIPTAVSHRDDLRIWLTAGEHDFFPASDQRAILRASPSPASLKKLVIIPGAAHGDSWRWPKNDALIREFLNASQSD